jgi:hypothetical protein
MHVPTRRHLTTILFLLRGYAQEQRRMHGKMVERPGGIQLTPDECEDWAQTLEGSAPAPTPAARKVIIQPKPAAKRGRK